MKKIYLTVLSLFVLLACDDNLELVPEQSISDQLAFSDIATAQGVLIGAYHLLQDNDVLGGTIQMIDEYMADNVNFSGSFPDLQSMNNYQQNALTTNVAANAWRDNYEAILAANAIVANAQGLPDATDDEKDVLEGEARFIRAIVYFQLCNMYGQPFSLDNGSSLAVPLYLEPFTGEVINLPRNTVAEVHTQVIADLEAARNLLPDVIEQGRASAVAVGALLSRVRLYREEWQQAADLANTVITAGTNSLAEDYTFYNTVSNEYIFTIENTAIDGSGNAYDLYYEGVNDGGRGDAEFAVDLENAFDAGDLRLALREDGTNFTGATRSYSTKFNDGATGTSDAPVIRISEINLTRAEALAELNGVNQGSLDLVNPIRIRAGLTPWTVADFASGRELVNAILGERRKELAFEGHRRLDLLRRGLPLRTATSIPVGVENGSAFGKTAGDDFIIYPIPQRELDLNPELQQNPGF